MVAELIATHSALRAHLAGWDALAVAAGRPFCAPAWLLAWWQHAAPPGSALRVVVVTEAARVVGVAPFYGVRGRMGVRELHPLGAGASQRVEPLAERGRETEVAARMAAVLGAEATGPDVVFFEGVDARSAWPNLLSRAWPGGTAAVLRRGSDPAPTLNLRGGDFDAWLAGKSRNFRHDLRKKRRAFERGGGRVRPATAETLEQDLAAFARLHHARWARRGGSSALTPGVEAMLADAAAGLLPAGRLRLISLELGGQVISSHIALTAGDEYAYWLAGFD